MLWYRHESSQRNPIALFMLAYKELIIPFAYYFPLTVEWAIVSQSHAEQQEPVESMSGWRDKH